MKRHCEHLREKLFGSKGFGHDFRIQINKMLYDILNYMDAVQRINFQRRGSSTETLFHWSVLSTFYVFPILKEKQKFG